MDERIRRQRVRLERAEAQTFTHYGVEVDPVFRSLTDPEVTVRVLRCGEGPHAVLLHGGGMTAAVWAPLLPHLPGRSLYLVDLPGCGLSDPFDYTGVDVVAHQQAFVRSLLDALGLSQTALIGSSLGGMYALRFALEAPAKVSALGLVSAPALALPGARVPLPMALAGTRVGRVLGAVTPPPSARLTRRILAGLGGYGAPPEVPEVFYDALGAASAIAVATNASLSQRLYRWRSARPEVVVTDEELAGCRVPMHLLWGDDDRVQSVDAAHRAAAILPDARVDVVPGGHGVWVDQPARCGALLTAFLDECDQAPSR